MQTCSSFRRVCVESNSTSKRAGSIRLGLIQPTQSTSQSLGQYNCHCHLFYSSMVFHCLVCFSLIFVLVSCTGLDIIRLQRSTSVVRLRYRPRHYRGSHRTGWTAAESPGSSTSNDETNYAMQHAAVSIILPINSESKMSQIVARQILIVFFFDCVSQTYNPITATVVENEKIQHISK